MAKLKVNFWATKKIPKRVRVSFRTKRGERVSFTATKKVPKCIKINFWASKPGKKVRRRKI